jgi:predicted ATPase
MLQALELTNFKCFAKQRIELGAVTLLAGRNGVGKSTILQALLLLRQSDVLVQYLMDESAKVRQRGNGERTDASGPLPSMILNGRYLSCGTARDVLHESATEDRVAIRLEWMGGESAHLAFTMDDHNRDTMLLMSAQLGTSARPYGPPITGRVPYVAAERIGPRMSHSVSAYHVDHLAEVGHDGAYTVAFLESHPGQEVASTLCRADAPATTLAAQVAAWMAEISPGIRLHTQHVPEVNAAALHVSFSSGRATSGRFRPNGVGFGISYSLPVVVTLLAASPGTLVLIENPEAHLHPRGQMALGELMAQAGAAGIQVIAETHSDHVVNGVRLAVKDHKVRADQVKFHYFTRRDDNERLVHEIESPRIDSDGRLDHWPDGFFDQWDLALERLL